MTKSAYERDVFLNCPFDEQYRGIFMAVLFAVWDSDFRVRCALEESTSGKPRLQRLKRLMSNCRLGIHDLSRIQSGPRGRLPRFNMPLELGMFLGAQWFGDARQRRKDFLVFDKREHDSDKTSSDLSGLDITYHTDSPKKALKAVRNWLCRHAGKKWLASDSEMWRRFVLFRRYVKVVVHANNMTGISDLSFGDLTKVLEEWRKKNPPQSFTVPRR